MPFMVHFTERQAAALATFTCVKFFLQFYSGDPVMALDPLGLSTSVASRLYSPLLFTTGPTAEDT